MNTVELNEKLVTDTFSKVLSHYDGLGTPDTLLEAIKRALKVSEQKELEMSLEAKAELIYAAVRDRLAHDLMVASFKSPESQSGLQAFWQKITSLTK